MTDLTDAITAKLERIKYFGCDPDTATAGCEDAIELIEAVLPVLDRLDHEHGCDANETFLNRRTKECFNGECTCGLDQAEREALEKINGRKA